MSCLYKIGFSFAFDNNRDQFIEISIWCEICMEFVHRSIMAFRCVRFFSTINWGYLWCAYVPIRWWWWWWWWPRLKKNKTKYNKISVFTSVRAVCFTVELVRTVSSAGVFHSGSKIYEFLKIINIISYFKRHLRLLWFRDRDHRTVGRFLDLHGMSSDHIFRNNRKISIDFDEFKFLVYQREITGERLKR